MSKQLTFSATICALTMAVFAISMAPGMPGGGKSHDTVALTIAAIQR
ncbi:hypothetical protein [Parerythrobacter jejuensis]|uniref:Uncharacterized protein n=1 Tax=Parerythrobacter jejuensis TaxID=795812 RepID=A0A845AN05_9SPHN|nr:hypothetical protein [Parerythrobacter jejuensis]MXP30275.1 hypothetical protein [Parerythrobacter jejuensis]MXP33035.1 hypothetical protein [Parerythrobacter jejuensis]